MAAKQADCQLPWQRMIAAPWRMLIAPAQVWVQLLDQPQWYWALLIHWLLAMAGWMFSSSAMLEMTTAAGLAPFSRPHPLVNFISMAIIMLVSLLSLALVVAWILRGAIRIAGGNTSYRHSLTWLLYGLLPYSIGHLAARLLFAMIKPLAENSQQTFAFILKPFSLGLAGFFPATFPPLSFGWFAFSYFDAFSIWSAILLILGAVHFLKLDSRKVFWLTLELVLISVAVITGLWNATQYLLLQLAG